MTARSFLFIDGHPLYRDGLLQAFATASGDLGAVTAADIAEGRTRLASDRAIAVCLFDRRLSDGLGLDGLIDVRRRFPSVAVGLLTADVTPDLCQSVRSAGGLACLSKRRDGAAIVDAVRSLLAGEPVFDAQAPTPALLLTERRRNIVSLAAQGWGDKQICSHLAITESGVRGHWHHIFGRLGANNRTEAVTKALRLRLI